jgi:hypothetical protein
MDDSDVWKFIDIQDLWVYDKLILAKKLGYQCGPAGVTPRKSDHYVIKPCVNFRMMGIGAFVEYLSNDGNDDDKVPTGYFWSERFTGRHLSFDYHYGEQVLAVEGFRDDPERLDRFSKWVKVDDKFTLPYCLSLIADKYEWLNVETIGGYVIEAHLRFNDDFSNHNSDEIIPIWNEDFYESKCGDRIGFLLK